MKAQAVTAQPQQVDSARSSGEFRIIWDDSRVRTLKASGAHVDASREAIDLFFGTSHIPPGNPDEVVFTVSERIILTPLNAKRLANLLCRTIENHESAGGAGSGVDPEQSGPAAASGCSPLPATSRGIAADKVRALFRMIDGLNIEYGFETSFKIYERTLLSNRFLLGFNKKQIHPRDFEKITAACKAMGMPASWIPAFHESLPLARFVHFGFEETPSGAVCKAYIEFDIPFAGKPESARPFLLYRGYKWDAADNTRRTLATYICFPFLSTDAILDRISGMLQGPEHTGALAIARALIAAVSEKMAGTDIVYVEVNEENNHRRSFDINVYKADLQLRDIYPQLAEMIRHYSISPEEFHAFYEPVKNKVLGHIAGGINREGKDFFTVYFGVEGRFSGSHGDTGFRCTHPG